MHCDSEAQAREVLAGIAERMQQVGLRPHPDKTQIVYCRDNNRPGRFDRTAFTFLGYTFRPRPARDRHGKTFLAFLPVISPQALKKISTQVRHWRLHRWIYHTFGEMARTINPVVAGWMQYYGKFYHLGAVSPPGTHQRLPGALDPQQVPTLRRDPRRPP